VRGGVRNQATFKVSNYPSVKIPANIKPLYLSRIEELGDHVYATESHEHMLELNANMYVVVTDLEFQLQR
jgi:hypothetical protein